MTTETGLSIIAEAIRQRDELARFALTEACKDAFKDVADRMIGLAKELERHDDR